MDLWGASLYGDPCRECGFDWSLTPDRTVELIADVPAAFHRASTGLDGSRRLDGWSVAEYTSHVADNLRQWAERLQAARLAGQAAVVGYDPDQLAQVRGYAAIPLEVALWSLRISVTTWVDVMSASLEENVVLQHSTRGQQRAQDVARNNAHDASHHLWDIRRIGGG